MTRQVLRSPTAARPRGSPGSGRFPAPRHRGIGHPLELDRILGDERNDAGGSFVTAEMFGTYRYGSELLDVTYDPGVPGELASFAADDEGTPAERRYFRSPVVRGRGWMCR